jgi:hypothetical protein
MEADEVQKKSIGMTAVVVFTAFMAWHTGFPQRLQAGPQISSDFTIVVLPDTQYYTDGARGATMDMFTAQTQWVAQNKTRNKIKAVIGLGDIVDNSNSTAEWQKADSAYRILDQAGLAYAPVLGNHDYDDLGTQGKRAATHYNTYFGPARFSRYPWYGGGYPTGSNENFSIAFTAGTSNYLVIALEYYPRTQTLEWAQRVVNANPDKEVIIATHSYLDDDGTRILKGGRHGPQSEGLSSANDNDAEEMWAKFISKNKRIILVLSGHICQGISIMARRSDRGENGNVVHQLLADYQWFTNGGGGYMRIMKFRPSKGVIEVRTYSPYLKAYLRDASNQFELKYAATPAGLGVGHLAAASLQAGLLAACLVAAVVIAALEEHTPCLLTLNFQTPTMQNFRDKQESL